MSDPIILRGYDDTWPAAFQQVATTIRRAFDAAELTIPRIDHIGSTAIPGIAAKPVIDLQISKIDLEPMTYRPALESLGYHWRAHNPELTKRMFRETRPMARTHIHVRRLGNWHEQFALLFRDHLRVSASDADRYEAEKKRLPDNTRTTGLPTQTARGQSFWTYGTHGPLGFRRGLATGANKRMCDDTHSHAISHRNVAVLVIGGTSHTGKSTLGHSLASDLGWRHLSNDAIARHPGRPFRGDSKVPGTLPESHYPRID